VTRPAATQADTMQLCTKYVIKQQKAIVVMTLFMGAQSLFMHTEKFSLPAIFQIRGL